MTRTILILTSKTGGGHISLAESLRDRLADAYTIELLDPQLPIFHWHYRMVSRYALWLWAAEFQLFDRPWWALQAHRAFTSTVAKPLDAAIKRIQPDLIITTYPFLSYEVIQELKKLGLEIPFIMLFADPNLVHGSWLTERRADATLAPTRETYAQALSANFDPARLYQVGWPVREQFYRVDGSQRAEMLERLGLNATSFTIFLQGGGEGAARFGRMVEHVLGIDRNLQVILATGTNHALQMRFDGVKISIFCHSLRRLPLIWQPLTSLWAKLAQIRFLRRSHWANPLLLLHIFQVRRNQIWSLFAVMNWVGLLLRQSSRKSC